MLWKVCTGKTKLTIFTTCSSDNATDVPALQHSHRLKCLPKTQERDRFALGLQRKTVETDRLAVTWFSIVFH